MQTRGTTVVPVWTRCTSQANKSPAGRQAFDQVVEAAGPAPTSSEGRWTAPIPHMNANPVTCVGGLWGSEPHRNAPSGGEAVVPAWTRHRSITHGPTVARAVRAARGHQRQQSQAVRS